MKNYKALWLLALALLMVFMACSSSTSSDDDDDSDDADSTFVAAPANIELEVYNRGQDLRLLWTPSETEIDYYKIRGTLHSLGETADTFYNIYRPLTPSEYPIEHYFSVRAYRDDYYSEQVTIAFSYWVQTTSEIREGQGFKLNSSSSSIFEVAEEFKDSIDLFLTDRNTLCSPHLIMGDDWNKAYFAFYDKDTLPHDRNDCYFIAPFASIDSGYVHEISLSESMENDLIIAYEADGVLYYMVSRISLYRFEHPYGVQLNLNSSRLPNYRYLYDFY